jgi:hypothetical protein
MPCRRIFGDVNATAAGMIEPSALFAHPKAEGLFGQRVLRSEMGRTAPELEQRQEMPAARH